MTNDLTHLPGHQAEEISFLCVLFAFANGLEGFSSFEFHVRFIYTFSFVWCHFYKLM